MNPRGCQGPAPGNLDRRHPASPTPGTADVGDRPRPTPGAPISPADRRGPRRPSLSPRRPVDRGWRCLDMRSIAQNWMFCAPCDDDAPGRVSARNRRYARIFQQPGRLPVARPPSRTEIPVDQQSHGTRLVEGICCARFQVAGTSSGGLLPAGRRDRTARTGFGPVRCPLPEKIGRDGAAGGWRGKRPGLARVCGSKAARRPWYRPEPKTSRSRAPGARRAAGGRDRAAPRTRSGRRGPPPAARTTDCRHHLSRSCLLVTGA
jgi:hypothetical protein